MGLIASSSSFTTQPQYPAPIDPSGLARNAKLFFNPGGSTVDVANTRGRVWTPNGNAKTIATPHGQAFNFDGSGSYLSFTGYPEIASNVGTLAIWFSRVGAPSVFGHVYFGDANASFQVDNNGKIYAWASPSAQLLSGWFGTVNRSIVFTSLDSSGSGIKVYVDGIDTGFTFSGSPASFAAGSKALTLGRYVGGSNWDTNASLISAVLLPNAISAADVKAFHDYKGWHLLQAPDEEIWLSSGGAVPLSSNSTPTATGAGTLSVAIPVTGASAAGVTGQGTLSIALPLSGAGNSAVVGSATLSISQALLGAGTPGTAGQGTLGLAIPLNSAALINVIGSGALNGSIALASNAAADVAGQSNLTLSIALSAAVLAGVLGGGNLAVSGALQGNSAAFVIGSGSLNQAIPIQSASLAATSASGNLTQLVPITASSVVLAIGQAGLILNIGMSAAALAQAIDVGDLTLRIALNAASVASATVAATLLSLPTPASRTVSVLAENRTLGIKGEDRTLRVAA